MHKKFMKFISGILAIVFSFQICIPPALAEKPCWNDSCLAGESGGVEGMIPGKPPENDFNCPEGGEPVNLATGAFTYQHQDLFIPSARGQSLEISRIYNSQNTAEGPFGKGWFHNYYIYLAEVSDGANVYVIRKLPNGNTDKFLQNPDGSYQGASHPCYDTLVKYAVLPPELQAIAPAGVTSGYHIKDKHGTGYLFDLSGKLLVIFDRNNNKTVLAYDTTGRLASVADAFNRSIAFAYNSANKITSVTDFSGRVFTYRYNAVSYLSSVITPAVANYPLGLITSYGYDDQGQIVSITDAKGITYLTNTYDSSGHVVEQAYGQGKFYFTYASDVTTLIDRKGFKTNYYLNSDGTTQREVKYTKPLRPDDPQSYTTAYEYNADKEAIKITHPKGNSVAYEYDTKGNVTKLIRKPAPGSSEPDIVTNFTYEPDYNFIKTVTDPKGSVTTYNYDSKGNLLNIVYPIVGGLTPQVSFTYNPYGQIETATNPAGAITKYEYAALNGYLVKTTADWGDASHLNVITQFVYDSLGNVISVTDPKGNASSFQYNALGQLTRTISASPFNYISEYAYDRNGNLERLSRKSDDPANSWQTTLYSYDGLDQLTSITDDAGNTSSFSYDANGNRILAIDPESHQTSYLYDERNLLYQVTDAEAGTNEYSYDENSNLKNLKDAKGNITSYLYDGFDRLSRTTYPDSSYEEYGYDANSNLISKRTRKADTITYSYDNLNRLSLKIYPDSSSLDYSYDIASRLTGVTDTHGAISYAYDSLNRVSSVTNYGKTVGYQYDANSNRVKLTYPDATYVTYSYDSLNRLTNINDQQGVSITQYSYDTLSRRVGVSYANNTSSSYQYDAINRLTQLTNTFSPTPNTYSYTYDKAGNRLTKTDTQGTTTYTYDNIYQLTQILSPGPQVASYTYDKLGNRVTAEARNYTANNLNQYTQVDTQSLSYDTNGNLLSNEGWSYSYDYENRLISASKESTTATYSYDGFGRRIEKNSNGTITRFLYDGDQIIAEYDSNNNLKAKYIFGPGIDEVVKRLSAQQTVSEQYYHYDGLGSVTELTDSSGTLIESYSYDAYGKTTIKDASGNTISQSAVGNRFGFTGRELDPETGLYYYRARMYSPELGRFLQTDPIGYYDSSNLYQYCGDNPVNFMDPMGLDKENKNMPWSYVLSSEAIQYGVSIINKGASAYFGQWTKTIETYAPGWAQGIARATNFQSAFQSLGILQGAFGYVKILNKVATGRISASQGYAAIGIHTVGMVAKVLVTTGATVAGTTLGGIWGAVGAAAILGTGSSIVIDWIEQSVFKFIGIS